MASYLTNS